MDLLREEDRPYFKAASDGRITCTLNGHTLPLHEEAVRAFTRCAARMCRLGTKCPAQASVLCSLFKPRCSTKVFGACSGPRYRHLRKLAEEAAALRQHEPWLVQSRNFPYASRLLT